MSGPNDAPRAPWPPRDRRAARDRTRTRQRRRIRLIGVAAVGAAALLIVSVAVAYQLGKSNVTESAATHAAANATPRAPASSADSSNLPTAPQTTPPPTTSSPNATTSKRHKKKSANRTAKVTSKRPVGSAPTGTSTGVGVAAMPSGESEPLLGKVIAIDPGHNPGNARYAAEVNRSVTYDGVHTKPCDTTGTDTRSGYPEYEYTWDVASQVAVILSAEGATVYLTRTASTPAWGPCIGDRAALGNRVHADAAVSIHGDGGPDSGHGFESIVPIGPIATAGLTSVMVAKDLRLALALRAAFGQKTGMVYSTYLGSAGIYRSNYYGGIDLSHVPKTLIETGNMRNDADAALMESPAWRARAAAGIALGITRFVRGA